MLCGLDTAVTKSFLFVAFFSPPAEWRHGSANNPVQSGGPCPLDPLPRPEPKERPFTRPSACCTMRWCAADRLAFFAGRTLPFQQPAVPFVAGSVSDGTSVGTVPKGGRSGRHEGASLVMFVQNCVQPVRSLRFSSVVSVGWSWWSRVKWCQPVSASAVCRRAAASAARACH